jgi:hypothetical protein
MSFFHSVCRLQVQQTSAAESLQKQKWCAKSDARISKLCFSDFVKLFKKQSFII